MSMKAAPHELGQQRFFGTPRPLPRILFCHVPKQSVSGGTRWCGRLWTANTAAEYGAGVKAREAHELLCGTFTETLAPSSGSFGG